MARPLRIEYPGAVYHITTRGNRLDDIFYDDQDRLLFLQVLTQTVKRYNWICYGYCLMDNHYHLLIETVDANLSLGMRQLNGIFTQSHNRIHKRAGHLFQGRFKSILVEKQEHLLHLCRYIVANPVKKGLCKHPSEWQWSSYLSTAYGDGDKKLLSTDWILKQFSKKKKRAKKKYRKFVEEGLQQQDSPWQQVKGQVFLGSDEFIEQLLPLLKNVAGSEIPKKQRLLGRPTLKKLFRQAIKAGKAERDETILVAYKHHCYSMKDIGEHLGLHYSTVSRIIKQQENR